jgi:outer membrane protein assembly factor BamB
LVDGPGDRVERWPKPTGPPITLSPTVSGGVVYLQTDRGELYVINAATGAGAHGLGLADATRHVCGRP